MFLELQTCKQLFQEYENLIRSSFKFFLDFNQKLAASSNFINNIVTKTALIIDQNCFFSCSLCETFLCYLGISGLEYLLFILPFTTFCSHKTIAHLL